MIDANFMQSQATIDGIRKRPGMYVSSTDSRGVYSLLLNFIEEIIDCNRKKNASIKVHLDTCDTFHITSDTITGVSGLLGLAAIKALSSNYSINMGQDSFNLVFKPDKAIFTYNTIEYYQLFRRLKELAQLNSNMKFILSNDKNNNILHFQHGLKDMLLEGVYEFGLVSDPLEICFVKNGAEVSVSMVYAYATDVTLSYFNNRRTHDGGTHVQGLLDGIFHAFQENVPEKILKIQKDDVTQNLNFVVNIKLPWINPHRPLADETSNIRLPWAGVAPREGLDWQNKSHMGYWGFSGSTTRELISENTYTLVKCGVAESLKTMLDVDQSFFHSSRVVHKAKLREISSRRALQ